MDREKDHFRGKSPLQHIIEAQIGGVEASLEIHGAETPGVLFSYLDAARETAVAITLLLLALDFFECIRESSAIIGISWALGWSFWKGARSTWLSWMRLERLHRIAREERDEIEENREQERQELVALYEAKGFKGPLLDQVVDVLMADEERLLRVMLQEEMGFRLHENQHPIFMGLGSFFGGITASIFAIAAFFLLPYSISIVAIVLFSALMGAIYARYENNDALHAGVWSGMVTAVTLVIVYALIHAKFH